MLKAFLRRFLAKLAFAAVALLAAAAGFVLALIFLFLAAYNALLLVLPAWGAALVMAGVALVVALLLVLSAKLVFRKSSRPKPRASEPDGVESILAGLFGDNARGLAEKNALVASLVALVAGVAAGLSPRLRDLVLKFLSV